MSGAGAKTVTRGRDADAPLTSGVSVRFAVGNDIAAGAKVRVPLLANGIHVMPAPEGAGTRACVGTRGRRRVARGSGPYGLAIHPGAFRPSNAYDSPSGSGTSNTLRMNETRV